MKVERSRGRVTSPASLRLERLGCLGCVESGGFSPVSRHHIPAPKKEERGDDESGSLIDWTWYRQCCEPQQDLRPPRDVLVACESLDEATNPADETLHASSLALARSWPGPCVSDHRRLASMRAPEAGPLNALIERPSDALDGGRSPFRARTAELCESDIRRRLARF